MISIRLVTPGLSSALTTSRPESVTAERTLRRITSGGSSTFTTPRSEESDVDMRLSGSWRSMIFAPISPYVPSGTTNVSPKRWLNRCAMSRASSRCWRWSSPTGTTSAS